MAGLVIPYILLALSMVAALVACYKAGHKQGAFSEKEWWEKRDAQNKEVLGVLRRLQHELSFTRANYSQVSYSVSSEGNVALIKIFAPAKFGSPKEFGRILVKSEDGQGPRKCVSGEIFQVSKGEYKQGNMEVFELLRQDFARVFGTRTEET